MNETAEQLIDRQLIAYNAHDVDAWLSTYAPDAIQRDGHGVVLAQGHEAIRQRTAPRMQDPHLFAKLLQRSVMGEVVIDHEIVTRDLPEGLCNIEMVCVYVVRSGLIQSTTFFMHEPVRLA